MAGMGSGRGADEDEDFYEEDEPLEKIVAAFERGESGITAPPIAVDAGVFAAERHTATQPAIVTLRPAAVEPVRPIALSIPA